MDGSSDLVDIPFCDNRGRELSRRRGHKFNVSSKESRTSDNIVFDSKWEMQVYEHLKQHLPREHFHLQPKFVLQDKFKDASNKNQRAIIYVADFLLGPARENDYDALLDVHEVIDCKGMETDVFKIKAKIFMYKYSAIIHRPKTGNLSLVYDIIESYKKTCNI